MESKVRFLPLNIGMKNNLVGLSSILNNTNNINVAFLQEVEIRDDQLRSRVGKCCFKCHKTENPL